MPQKTQLVRCSDREVDVDIKQGLARCIEAQQCFSDEPCPLQAKFNQSAAQTAKEQKTEALQPAK